MLALASFFWAAWGTIMGASSSSVRILSRFPTAKTEERFLMAGLEEEKNPLRDESSTAIRSSLPAASSNWKKNEEQEQVKNPKIVQWSTLKQKINDFNIYKDIAQYKCSYCTVHTYINKKNAKVNQLILSLNMLQSSRNKITKLIKFIFVL